MALRPSVVFVCTKHSISYVNFLAYSVLAAWLPGPAWPCLCTADQGIPIVLPRATSLGPIIHILTYAHYYQHWIMRIPHGPQHHTDAILYQSRQSTKRNMKINCFYIDKLTMSKPEEYLTKKWSNSKLLFIGGKSYTDKKMVSIWFPLWDIWGEWELPLLHKCQIPGSQYTSVHRCIKRHNVMKPISYCKRKAIILVKTWKVIVSEEI